MIKKYLLFICLFLVFLTACELFTMGHKESLTEEDIEPAYNADVVWTLEVETVKPIYETLIHEHYLYVIESLHIYEDMPEEFNIAKIDLKTGSYVWKSPTVTGVEDSYITKNGDKLFIQAGNERLYCFSNENGILLATLKLSNGEYSWRGTVLSNDTYLYWGTKNRSVGNGLLRFDITSIDFTKNPAEEQDVSPEMFWDSKEPIWSLAVESDGLIYALTYNDAYKKGGKSTLAAIDAQSKVVKWTKDFQSPDTGYPFMYPIGGLSDKPLYIVGDYLYVIDYGLGCFNKLTGETVWEVVQSSDDLHSEVYLTASILSDGVEFWDGKFYYAGASDSGAPFPKEFLKNILCINAKDGSLEWGAMPLNSATMGGKPVVANGKLYMLANDRLSVYNAKNGKLIGVKTVPDIDNMNCPVAYNDMVIYLAPDIANRKSVLTAIRAN